MRVNTVGIQLRALFSDLNDRRFRLIATGFLSTLLISCGSLLWKLQPVQVPLVSTVSEKQINRTVWDQPNRTPRPLVSSLTSPPESNQEVNPKQENSLIVRATWSRNRNDLLNAISVEPTRCQNQVIDLSITNAKLLLSLPAYDDRGQSYSQYRLIFSANKVQQWQKTLSSAPEIGGSAYVHVLLVSISTRTQRKKDFYELKISARVRNDWQPLGRMVLRPKQVG